MLGTDLEQAAHFKAIQMYLNPCGWFESHLDRLRVLKPSVRTNVLTKLSTKLASKPSLPMALSVQCGTPHSDPLQG